MILKKPYAFLIKYFKIIHITMFLMLGYLVFVLRRNRLFFVNYVKDDHFTYIEKMENTYIPILAIIFTAVILISAILIYSLMHKKEKPVLYYRVLIIYSVILLGTFIYLYFFYKSLSLNTYNQLSIVIIRDIVSGLYYINFFYVIFSFIRGFGFDIKKFSFERDKKELNIQEEDSEEYELNLNVDKDNIKQYFHKRRREIGYYFKENALIFITILILIIVGLLLYFYFNYFVINKIYNQNDIITIGEVNYHINSSYITNKDKNDEIISNNYDYIIVNINIKNNGNSRTFDSQKFRINIDEKYYYPVYNMYSSFSDLGVGYNNNEIKKDSDKNYILVFKIPKGTFKKAYFEILKTKNNFKYDRVLLDIQKNEKTSLKYELGDEINVMGNQIVFSNLEIVKDAQYQYEECYQDTCHMYTKNVRPHLGNAILKITASEQNRNNNSFYNDYVSFKFGDRVAKSKSINLIDRYNNILYFDVPSEFQSEGELLMIITTRDSIYEIKLRGDEDE